ncbi:MAG: hypothetical protein AAB595_02190 [Patescibacteria group bacterium]
MPYITNSNVRKITGNIDTRSVFLDGDIYNGVDFPYFNNLDKKILLATKKFFENISEFLKIKYEKVEKQTDTYSFVYEYEGSSPSYHKLNNCPRLLSDYKNFAIPVQIMGKGKEEILRYRKWFKENEQFLESDAQGFINRLDINFRVGISKSELALLKKEFGNSGHLEIKDANLNTLEDDIHNLIKKADLHINESEKNRIIFNKYIKHTYKWNKPDLLFVDNTNYSDKEIKDILKFFEITIKSPLKEKLEYYYQLKFNPEIEFQGELLDQLGFVKCQECYYDKVVLPFNINDFINIKN